MKNLADVWKAIDDCEDCKKEGNKLQHILGGGKTENPKFMIVFINPTARNMSSDKSWMGPRFPFIGRKKPWDIFEKIGLMDNELLQEINKNENKWSYGFANKVLEYLEKNGLYITNIIKCTGKDATLPTISKINSRLPLFKKEIEFVNPKVIILFGSLPTKALLKTDIKMSDFHKKIIACNKPEFYNVDINGKIFKAFPCYYPIGRGNTKGAIEMLNIFNRHLKNY